MNTETESTSMQDQSLDQLEQRMIVVETESATIKAKLDHVRGHQKLTGEFADPDWYRRAKTRARFLGVEHQHLIREIAKRKREASRTRSASIERAFVGAAKRILSDVGFAAIMEAAEAEVTRG